MRIDLGSDDRTLALPFVNVSDGLWHTARMQRWGNQAILQLDGGDGRYVVCLNILRIDFSKHALTMLSLRLQIQLWSSHTK